MVTLSTSWKYDNKLGWTECDRGPREDHYPSLNQTFEPLLVLV